MEEMIMTIRNNPKKSIKTINEISKANIVSKSLFKTYINIKHLAR